MVFPKKVSGVLCLFVSFFLQAQVPLAIPDGNTASATIHVDLNKETGEMTPVWAWFGYDEPNYTYMKDGKKLLSEIAALSPVQVYVRAMAGAPPGMEPRQKMGH